MVPELKPEAANVLLKSFINNEDYPSLQKPGSSKPAQFSAKELKPAPVAAPYSPKELVEAIFA
jgi:hypothetical protein